MWYYIYIELIHIILIQLLHIKYYNGMSCVDAVNYNVLCITELSG